MGLQFVLGRLAGLDLIDSLALRYLRLGVDAIFPKIINFVIDPANFKSYTFWSTLPFWPQFTYFLAENVRLRPPGTPLGTTTTSIA